MTEQTDIKVLGVLRKARLEFDNVGDVRIGGLLYEDSTGSYMDGQRMVIGPILGEMEGGFMQTPKGIYRVEMEPLPEDKALRKAARELSGGGE